MMHATIVYHIFRIACAMCFIGHGIFGVITKPIWCKYFGVFGVGEALAYKLMPAVGIADIALGLVLLVFPLRFAAVWLVGWGFFTALLRPLSGEPFAEFLERAGNFGAPLVLLMLGSLQGQTQLFKKLQAPMALSKEQWRIVIVTLQLTAFTLLLGHGWLNLIGKQGLLNQYASLGFASPLSVARIVGTFEIAGALSLVIAPLRPVILALFIWKMASEMFYPAYAILEWVERGGSYATLLGLWMIMQDANRSAQALSLWPQRERHPAATAPLTASDTKHTRHA